MSGKDYQLLCDNLTEHYIPDPTRLIWVKVNDKLTTGWDRILVHGDVVTVYMQYIGVRTWRVDLSKLQD